jgi:hypothetical protein
MIQEVYNRYVRVIILHVYKEGVDLPDRKKIKEIEKKNVIYDSYTMLCRWKIIKKNFHIVCEIQIKIKKKFSHSMWNSN